MQAKDVQIGDIHFFREFDSTHLPETSAGVGRHTTIIIDKTKEEVITIGDDRAMPDLEDIGIVNFSLVSEFDKQVMFLRLSYEYIKTLPDPYNLKKLIYSGVQDLPEIIKYLDQKISFENKRSR